MQKDGYVYILANNINGTIYTGVTSNLIRRVWQHKQHVVTGFTHKYDAVKLVWYESHDTIESAIQREKQLKNWRRKWKLELVNGFNPEWQDLYESLI